MIEAESLTKHYGTKVAVEDLSFTVRPGVVTGFLGPNGSGKSTTMRLIMGLDAPNRGHVSVNGKRFAELNWPLREVGALLEARAIHPGRSARAHLRMLAQMNRLPARRVDDLLELVGLTTVADQRAGKFSLGMNQRLGIAASLLGDPGVLLFDEPVNGLDPDGIRWIRNLLKGLASEGRTVFVSSHLMSEMALTADEVIIIGRGHLIEQTSIGALLNRGSMQSVRVRSPQLAELAKALEKTRCDDRAGKGRCAHREGRRRGRRRRPRGLTRHRLARIDRPRRRRWKRRSWNSPIAVSNIAVPPRVPAKRSPHDATPLARVAPGGRWFPSPTSRRIHRTTRYLDRGRCGGRNPRTAITRQATDLGRQSERATARHCSRTPRR